MNLNNNNNNNNSGNVNAVGTARNCGNENQTAAIATGCVTSAVANATGNNMANYP